MKPPPDPPEPAPDDPAISDDELLYRRVHSAYGFTVDRTTGTSRLSSEAWEFQEDGISVYRHDELRRLGLSREDVLIDHPDHRVAVVAVHAVRAITPNQWPDRPLGVVADPNPAPIPGGSRHPCDGAHALIKSPGVGGKAQLKMRRTLASKASVA